MSSNVPTSFGELLQSLRKQKKIRQQALAEMLGVHRNTIGAWERGDHLPDTRGIVLELAQQLRLDEDETRLLLEASLTGLSPYWLVPYPRNSFFTGRHILLRTLHNQLRSEQAVALSQSYALSGLGGIGKTQLALEYVYLHALEYHAIFWVAAETVDTLFSSFATIAEQLQLSEREEKDYQKMVKAVLHWFTTHKEWLLIFDNVEAISTLKPFLPAARQGAILLTTRRHTLEGLAHPLDLPPLPGEEGLQFLLRRVGLIDLTSSLAYLPPDLLEAARSLVAAMDGLPLALDQAGAYIERTGCSLNDYLQLFQSHRVHLLAERSPAADHPHSVVNTFLLSFEKMLHANPAAADLLRICAFLAPDAIPEELFTQGAAHLGPLLGPVASDPLLFNQAIGEALHYSLLQRQSQSRTLSLHRLVQVVLKAVMDRPTSQLWATRVAEAFAACVSLIENDQIWSSYNRYLPHAQYVIQLIQELHIVSSTAAEILFQTGKYFHAHAQYAEAEQHYLQAIQAWEGALGPDHILIAKALNSLGILYRQQGKHEQAKQNSLCCISLREQAFGSEHFTLIEPLTNVAVIAAQQGKYAQAEPILLRCISLCEVSPHSNGLEIARVLNNLANIYYLQGKYEEAEPGYIRSLHIREQMLGSEHPSLNNPLHNLGNVYKDQGKYEQAELLYLRALHIWEQTLGSEHPDIASLLCDLGNLRLVQKKYEQAEQLYLRVLHILEQVFGPDHLYRAHSFQGLGNLYRALGKNTEALIYYQRALTIRQQHLGKQHQDTAETLHAFATLYYQRGSFDQAKELYQNALAIREQAFGLYHPKTLETRTSYVQLLRDSGKDEEATRIETQLGNQLETVSNETN